MMLILLLTADAETSLDGASSLAGCSFVAQWMMEPRGTEQFELHSRPSISTSYVLGVRRTLNASAKGCAVPVGPLELTQP